MYAGAMYAWGWLKRLTQTEEQKFTKSDSTKRDEHKSLDVHWTFADFIFVTTCFQIDLIYLCDMGYMLKDERNSGFLQIMIIYATWGPALIYMEIFLGQYVQHGCLYLKNMSPLTCSTIGYAMLLTMYFSSVATVSRLADSYMFLFRSFSSELPWMVCPKGSTPETCIDRELLVECYLKNKRDNCYPTLGPELLSSRIYYKAIHGILANRVPLLLFGWLTIYIALKRTLGETRVIVKRLVLLILVLFLCLLTPLVVHVSRGVSVVPFFSLRYSAVFDIAAWIAAFKTFLKDHATVRGGWQLIGCHIKPGPTAANLTIYSCALTYLITVFCQIFSTGILGVLIFYMKITRIEEELYFPKYAKLFNFYPFALGMMQVRQVWSLIFFILVALSSISYTMVSMTILEESIYDEFPVMLRYRGYVKVLLCSLGFCIGTVTTLLSGVNSYEDEVVLQIGSQLTKVVILILTFSIGYIYGTERFCDDMNFLNGSQPTRYWKICWKSLPFGILILLGGEMIIIEFPRKNMTLMISNIIYVILLGLALLRMLYQIVMSIKARNVAGMLFQARTLWGSPLPEDRRLRNMYNPREETKYWRKNNLCTHHCLLNTDFILSVIFREVDSRTANVQHKDTPSADRLHPHLLMELGQLKQNQIVIAIDKVSSTQLETFEEQVKQKVRLMEKIEQTEFNYHRRRAMIPRNKNRVRSKRSIEEFDGRIEELIMQEEQKIELERESNKTSSRTKQRRLPTFVPMETPRPKKTLKAADLKDTKDKKTAKLHTYTVEVPHFVLKPPEKLLQHPEPLKSAQKQKNLVAWKSPPTPPFLCSKSTSCRVSQQQPVWQPRLVTTKPRLPVWPLPLDTPRPTVASKLSGSSSSTSTESREAHFLNVPLPPKPNLPLPAIGGDFHSQSESSGSSVASSELSVLNRDPVLRGILRSVRPELIPAVHRSARSTSSRTDAIVQDPLRSTSGAVNRSQPESKTAIARRAPPIGSPAGRRKRRAEEEELAVDIDQAIQIRIDDLLRGVREPGQSTDRRPDRLYAVPKTEHVKTGHQTKGTAENLSHESKAKKKLGEHSPATSSVTAKTFARKKRIAKRMTR